MSDQTTIKPTKYVLMTTDPVHIGTGGTRLGRVDQSIVREPGTRLPKIPGTSLSGAVRHYAAARYGKPICASVKKQCGKKECPICYTFGTANTSGDGNGGYKGVVSIGDARLLLFPVYSMAGPVWITSPDTLRDYGLGDHDVGFGKALLKINSEEYPNLNLGWLMVSNRDAFSFPADNSQLDWLPDSHASVKDRIVVVHDQLFSQVVNSNLEVRTSVAINPETGAAEDKALFTHESIPRAAYLWMELVVDDFRQGDIWENGGVRYKAKGIEDEEGNVIDWLDDHQESGPINPPKESQSSQDESQLKGWNGPQDVYKAGLEWVDMLGVGGMGTRGFGRVRIVYEEV